MTKRRSDPSAGLCPCGSGLLLEACCGPRLDGSHPAPTAEALMRSRYVAYVRQDADYLRASWHPDTCPEEFGFDTPVKWLGLRVEQSEAGQEDDQQGVVRFAARYKVNGRAGMMQETSRFVRLDGRWVYVDGKVCDD
ncbi:YchJ family protein [Laribacter hongkongensis]|uniref:YchJ family protein n=1 Tax=Laribacter hongkongensis TaxID=168471 RepID=UPI0023D90DFE|nr:YchJ family metal-binding protein [Laribacter hongkongensis]MCG9080595.1 SEC-C domain-containing protein [Laribacter hongkongensis]